MSGMQGVGDRPGPVRRAVAGGVLACLSAVLSSCAAAPAPAPAPAPAAVPAAASSSARAADDGRHGRHGGDGPAAAVALPADFPPGVPLPPGNLRAATGAEGRWSVLLVVNGSAADALAQCMRFYSTAGFIPDSASTAHREGVTITLVTENRDHSPTSTDLVVGVTA